MPQFVLLLLLCCNRTCAVGFVIVTQYGVHVVVCAVWRCISQLAHCILNFIAISLRVYASWMSVFNAGYYFGVIASQVSNSLIRKMFACIINLTALLIICVAKY